MNPKTPAENSELASLHKSITLAAQVADGAPENYRDLTYEVVLGALLNGRTGGPAFRYSASELQVPGPVPSRETPGPARSVAMTALLGASNEALEPYAFIAQLEEQRMKIYAALLFARDKFAIDGLTEGEIRQLLAKKFRVNITHGTAAGLLSRANPSEINPSRLGSKTVFSLMRTGEEQVRRAQAALGAPG